MKSGAAVSNAPVGGFGVTANDATINCCEGLAFGGTDPMGNYALVVPVGRHVRVFFGGGPASLSVERGRLAPGWPAAKSAVGHQNAGSPAAGSSQGNALGACGGRSARFL